MINIFSFFIVIFLSLFGAFGYFFYLYQTRVNMEILLLREHNRLLKLKIVALEQQSISNNNISDWFSNGDAIIMGIGILIVG